MTDRKRTKAAILFSAIGDIDDCLVHEAAAYRSARRKTARPLWLLAASLCLCAVLVFGGVLIADRARPNAPEDDGQEEHLYALDDLLQDSRESAEYRTVADAEALDLFAAPVVVWQYSDSDELCVSRPLTSTELSRLTSRMGTGMSVGSEAPSLACRVWIVMGDGTVQTPYLKSSDGNVGTELFDYNPEILPDEPFVTCLSEILH